MLRYRQNNEGRFHTALFYGSSRISGCCDCFIHLLATVAPLGLTLFAGLISLR
jgi:hypothetical protein